MIARNVGELLSSNRSISHFYAACCINELSRGPILGPKSTRFLASVNSLLLGFCVMQHIRCNKLVNHDGHQGNAAQAPVEWWHLVASSEARDVLRVMHPISHCHIRMVKS